MNKDNVYGFIKFLNVYYNNYENIDINNSDYENYINYFAKKFTCKEYILFSEYLKIINEEFQYER